MELYFAEAIIFILLQIAFIIICRIKQYKVKLWGSLIILLLFVISIGITFFVETPKFNIEESIDIEVNQQDSLYIPKVTYHFKDISEYVTVNGNLNLTKVGTYEIEYIIPTLIGNYKKSQKINVIDTISPEIILKGDVTYNQSYKKDYEEPGYIANDNYDRDITEKVQITKQEISDIEYNIIYSAEDSSGNKATAIRNIHIIDDIAPIIKLKGSSYIKILINGTYKEQGATATDEKDGNLTDKIQVSGKVDTSKAGTYTITYTVTDNSGNVAKQTRKVVVYKETIKAQTGENGTHGVIYLTFDDGPSTSITPKVLDILRAKNVKATFFILNYNAQGEELVKRELAEGHTVGIHGYSHVYKDIYQSVDTYMENITKLQDKIFASTGYNATITRFPGGSSNKVSRFNPGIMTELCRVVVERGYKYFDWNVSSGDAGGARTSQDVYNNVVNGLRPNRANVVLMHDFNNNTKTLNALESIIDYGIENGYTFSNITESTPMVTHTPNN